MKAPHVGDTFTCACPFCSPEKTVVHAIYHVGQNGKKYTIDAVCTERNCFRTSSGSLEPGDDTLHVTWLEYKWKEKPTSVKTAKISSLQSDAEWQQRLTPPPEPNEKEEKHICDEMLQLLRNRKFQSKGDLEFALAQKFPQFAEVNLSFDNVPRLALPVLSNLAKTLRVQDIIPFEIRHGHHVYGKGKLVPRLYEKSQEMAWKILQDHLVFPGPIQVSVCTYIPVDDEKNIAHFFQSITPKAALQNDFGSILLECLVKEKKVSQARFWLDQMECNFSVKASRLEVTGKFQEKYLSRTLIKLVLVSLRLAYEISCAAHQDRKILRLDGKPNFPSILIVHNSLNHSEALWKTEFSNIHRNFYAFPGREGESEDCTVSERVILSHVPAYEFSEELLEQHLEKFRLLFLREIVRSLEIREEFIPPSILKTYAPKSEETEQLVGELTTLYEERFKKNQLEKVEREAELKIFLNRSNMWLSVVVLLFSLATVAKSLVVNGIIIGISIMLVIFIFIKNATLKQEIQR